MRKYIWALALLVLAAALLCAGCSRVPTPYETNDKDNYTLSVQYDANGGLFTTNTSIITDSYSLAELPKNGQGQVEIPLLSPDSTLRGNDAFTAVKSGYFLAGWYTQRTETTGADGKTAYTYSGRWDFETDRLTADGNKTYTSAEPVLTLYAAWVPEFTVDFYDMESGQLLDTYTFNPTEQGTTLQLPTWDEKTGGMKMHKFPKREGYTFTGAFYDLEGNRPVEGDSLTHTGTVDLTTGSATGGDMTLYLTWDEGEWYHIHTVEQFLDSASINGHYILEADLDFTGKIWPTSLMYGNFAGSIEGGGHTIRNVTLTQTNNSKVNAGLFGQLTEEASLKDVTFENVTFTVKAGTRVAGTSYGVLAGTLSSSCTVEGVALKNSTLQIDSGCYFGVEDYTIGLVCGLGPADRVEAEGLTCIAVGDAPEKVAVTVSGNTVTLAFPE